MRIVLWSSDYTITTGQAIVTKYLVDNTSNVLWVEINYGKTGVQSIYNILACVFKLYTEKNIDLYYAVVSRSFLGFIRDIPLLMLALSGRKVILHVHGSDVIQLFNKVFYGRIAAYLYSKCMLIVPSSHLIEPLSLMSINKVCLVENFVPQCDENSRVNDIIPIGPYIVWNSNIMATKGFIKLLNALIYYNQHCGRLNYVVFGKPLSDSEKTSKEMRSVIQEALRYDWFEYRGPRSISEVSLTLKNSGLYVFPSYYSSECQPLSLIQAMCAGLPVIVNDTPALRATVGDYPAIFINSSDDEELLSHLKKLIYENVHIETKYVSQARMRFSGERFLLNMEQIFNTYSL